jgi:uncharacterized OB-fold protein
MHRPVPVPDDISQPFWQAANEGRLVIQRCTSCRRYYHPPVGTCFECLTAPLVYEPVSGRGTIYSFTITHDARQPAFEAIQPFPVVVVELEEQAELFLLTNMPGTPLDAIRIGAPVEVRFEELTEGHAIPEFQLATEQSR